MLQHLRCLCDPGLSPAVDEAVCDLLFYTQCHSAGRFDPRSRYGNSLTASNSSPPTLTSGITSLPTDIIDHRLWVLSKSKVLAFKHNNIAGLGLGFYSAPCSMVCSIISKLIDTHLLPSCQRSLCTFKFLTNKSLLTLTIDLLYYTESRLGVELPYKS